ncbi:MAG: DNA mismatch repair endonuclease MutL [Chloroflexi bacterium]|nr:DNA mismatch repair endonuclease MutL [Chloroflexota bacterium]
MAIHILSDDLAAKIEAGEVIERPASVVKELVDNAIDAGAREIKIEIRGGGQRLIRVADDGGGIPAREVETAFARHATSKIDSADDLFTIQTLGFRGEALPSIASVARVTLITRARGEDAGTQIKMDGGKQIEKRAQGAPQGTIITVEDLFRHVPARLKFLKQPGTEAGHIADLINAYALAFPHLRFAFINEDRLAFQSPGTGKMFDALVKVLGIEIANQMIEVGRWTLDVGSDPSNIQHPREASNIQVSGYVSPPSITRSNRKQMLFFVNHRAVQDRTLQHAVIEAYHTALMVGRAPIVALDVTVPPDMVDVNVHPTKSEVRFRDTHTIFTTVQRAVRAALTAHAPIPTITFSPRDYPAPTESQLAIDLHRPLTNYQLPSSNFQTPTIQPANYPTNKLPMLRVLGQILSTYIIAEGSDGLYLIDQHAAHERVLYEQLSETHRQAQGAGANIATQDLLDPAPLQLTPAQIGALETHRDALASVGFRIEEFGGQTILLRAIPAVMKKSDPRATLVEIIDELEQGEAPLEKSAEARLITSVCKSIAVKGGQVLSLEEMRELIRRLEQTTAPRTCPHGRPTMIQLNLGQLEREFGRK